MKKLEHFKLNIILNEMKTFNWLLIIKILVINWQLDWWRWKKNNINSKCLHAWLSWKTKMTHKNRIEKYVRMMSSSVFFFIKKFECDTVYGSWFVCLCCCCWLRFRLRFLFDHYLDDCWFVAVCCIFIIRLISYRFTSLCFLL